MKKFTNVGNTCYLNSVLQVLCNIKRINKDIIKYNENDSEVMALLQNILSPEIDDRNTLKSIIILKEKLAHIDSCSHVFGNRYQQDAHEALFLIIDIIHKASVINFEIKPNLEIFKDNALIYNSLKEKKRVYDKFGYSFVSEIFDGQFITTTSCTNCDYKNPTYIDFLDINLSITKYELVDCLIDFFEQEKIQDSVCEKCNQNTLIKKNNICIFPNVLIISLNRFGSSKNKNPIKINKQFKIHGNSQNYIYKLHTIVNHIGSSTNSGHYNVNVLKNAQWYEIDDDSISEIECPQISTNCYLLIYDINSS